jgi:hypothetical protein
MLMLFREDRLVLYNGGTGKDQNSANDKDYLGNDKFFTINYDERFAHKNNILNKFRHFDNKHHLKTTLTINS